VDAAQSPTEMETFKSDFQNILIFLHPQIPDFKLLYLCQILSYSTKPYINGHLFIQLSGDVQISTLKKRTHKTAFVVQGHIC